MKLQIPKLIFATLTVSLLLYSCGREHLLLGVTNTELPASHSDINITGWLFEIIGNKLHR
jgi:hypothetical protein